jgi:hypothetical protein
VPPPREATPVACDYIRVTVILVVLPRRVRDAVVPSKCPSPPKAQKPPLPVSGMPAFLSAVSDVALPLERVTVPMAGLVVVVLARQVRLPEG